MGSFSLQICKFCARKGRTRPDWEHSIPPLDALRYSVTFRTLRRA
jgi:hypothetical protein